MSAGDSLVCGFADPGGAAAGCWWRLDGAAGSVLKFGDAVAAGEVEPLEAAQGTRAKLTADGVEVEVALQGAAEALAPAEDATLPVGGLRAAVCEAKVELEQGGRRRTIPCGGFTSSWEGGTDTGAEAIRHLVIPLGEDSLLLLVARRPAGAEGHGEELSAAWRLEAGLPPAPFAEALLSTQYDDAGGHTRAGVELWPAGDEAPPTRAAGTTVGEGGGDGVAAALLRTSAEGAAGFGTYVIWRP